VLRERLQKRNYSAEKIQENLEAEALDIILCESAEWCDNVFEIDTTSQPVEKTLSDILNILDGLVRGRERELADRYRPGSVDWSEDFFS
jgi:adenylate kinase